MRKRAMAFLAFCALTVLGACALPVRTAAVPPHLDGHAVPAGLKDVRYVVGDAQDMDRLRGEFADTWARERAWLHAKGRSSDKLPPTSLLALSGGGDKGAFGAGLLNGWSATGKRPEFKLVTGISTGALIAPFAFLGPAYDAKLKDFYTNTARADLIRARSLLSVLTNDAVEDTWPLREMLGKQIDRAFLDAIAAEYLKGRELWVSTTNLDANRRVIWNMTKIASSLDPRALGLFLDVIMASAAIPGAFPPVMIDVEVDGRAYQEMHVDGGATAQVFVYPPGIDLANLSQERDGERQRTLYIIMNARLDPEWADTERRAISIAGRAIISLIHTQGVGDLNRLYLTATHDGLDFNLAYIPPDFDHPHPQQFDIAYMRALFDVGYRMAGKDSVWQKVPPDFQGYAQTGK